MAKAGLFPHLTKLRSRIFAPVKIGYARVST